jgi:hypothetical protein
MSLRKPGKGTRQPHGRPPSLACAMARVLIQHQRKCGATKRDGTPCRMVALSGARRCGHHGGFHTLIAQGRYKPRRVNTDNRVEGG